MSESAPDIARIVNLIMENPKLIEEISNMARADAKQADTSEPTEPVTEVSAEPIAAPQPRQKSIHGRNRSQLLGALKPYVSRERAQAIDSMLSIVEILDAMTGR